MDLGLTDRVAIVEDADHDVGRQVALALVNEGARVSICARKEEGLRRAEFELARVGSQQKILAIPADLSAQRDMRRVIRDTFNRFGQIDILVIHSQRAHLPEEKPAENASSYLDKHFLRVAQLVWEVALYMKQEHWGRIINLETPQSNQDGKEGSSLAGHQLHLIGYLKNLAKELAPFNITVNSLLSGNLEPNHPPEVEDAVDQKNKPGHIPMRRLGKVEEIGDMAAFLASERAGYLTGAIISVDGGQGQEFW